MTKCKKLGQVFTPSTIVDFMLNEINYKENDILNKKIFEPSFGDGAFLIQIVTRLINVCIENNMSPDEIKEILQTNIYGIEIDEVLFYKTINKLNKLCLEFDIKDVAWNLFNTNTLTYEHKVEYDYIVGNPPYVRIHNMTDDTRHIVKSFRFSKGNIDLYIIFFELCINLLTENGKLIFITPNTYMKNSSNFDFRKYLIDNNLLNKIIDFRDSNIFPEAKTYTAITYLIKNQKSNHINYEQYSNLNKLYNSRINLKDITDTWDFNKKEDNCFLNEIYNREIKLNDLCQIQYGINTNRNTAYIGKVTTASDDTYFFNGYEIEKDLFKKVVKSSKYNGEEVEDMILFPYKLNLNNKYEPILEDELSKEYPLCYKYFLDIKDELINRDMDKGAVTWYQFARSQGIINCNQKKLTFKHIIKNNMPKIKAYMLPEDVIVYSGIYLSSNNTSSLEMIRSVLESKDFYRYCRLVGKDMRGGYKVINSKHIKNFGVS